MAFTNIKYQSNANGVYRMRLSADKAGLAGDEAVSAAITDPNVEVIVTKNRRKYGISPRGVRFSRTLTATGGATFKQYVFIPATTPTIQADLLAETSITYRGETWSDPIAVAES